MAFWRAARALAGRPGLWPTAVRQARRTVPSGWWRRRPFVPVPPSDYIRFRMLTQYGNAERAFDPDDLVRYLAWCREWDRSLSHGNTSG